MANQRNFNHPEGPNAANDTPERNPEGLPRRTDGDADIIRDIRFAPAWGFIFDGSNGESPSRAVQGRIRGTDIAVNDPFWDPPGIGPRGKALAEWGLYPGNFGEINGVGFVDQGFVDLETFDFSKYNLGWDNDYYTRLFDNANFSIEQVLFNGNVGFEIGFDTQYLGRSDFQAFNAGNAVVTFDINRSIPVPVDPN